MNLENFERMDSVMLMSIINMKLRDEFHGDINELVQTYSMDLRILQEKLATAGFTFIPEIGQFR